MKTEGLRIPLSQDGFLESSGILSGASPQVQSVLPAQSIALFLQVALAGPEGLSVAKIPKEFKKDLTELVLPLEIEGLVQWEFNARGQRTYLQVTWKGQDAIDAARPKQRTKSLKNRRAALRTAA